MKIVNIYPLGNLSMHYTQDMHMFLTHLAEDHPFYADFARDVKGYKILDNSLIEMGGAVDLKRVLAVAEYIKADEIILPDVFQDGPATIEAVNKAIAELQEIYPHSSCPFKLQAVAHGKDVQEWYECYHELLNNPYIDVVGIPKVLAKMHPQGRPYFVNELCDLHKKPHHLLGMWYSMTEIEEYNHGDEIRSCDTVLLGYMAKHNLGPCGTRPDGFTVDLVNDVIDYSNLTDSDKDKYYNLRRTLK